MSERLENIFSRDPEIYVSTLLGATELDDRCILFAPDTGIVDGNFNFCFSRISSVNGDHVTPPSGLDMISISNADADHVTARVQNHSRHRTSSVAICTRLSSN